MPRRRGRFVLLIAVVMVIMLYRVFLNSEWESSVYSARPKHPVPPAAPEAPIDAATEQQKQPLSDAAGPIPPTSPNQAHEENGSRPDQEQPAANQPPIELPKLKSLEHPADFGLPTKPTSPSQPVSQSKAESGPEGSHKHGEDNNLDHSDAASQPTLSPDLDKLDEASISIAASSTTTKSQIHWHKVPEHFPVPEGSLIPLPTGTPKSFPKIQHDFPPESPLDKETREKRLALVRAEAQRSWNGYRKYAWMHDELSPVTMRFRDPFCGWAATLVDSLDTLWIMGLKDEFDEAANAVKDIDFTYSTRRRDIPVFETIIRYLGGLVAAFDVSGGHQGKYPMLLEKAVELAEILMGVFDTPNRLPILYYNWMPESVSQPHRAGVASVAELASMSVEFTRLAQLTGEDKYYDAIARITNGLKDLQDRGTSVPGLFPESLDISGCNRTATALLAQEKARKLEEEQAKKLQSQGQSQGSNPSPGPAGQQTKGYPPVHDTDDHSHNNNAPHQHNVDEDSPRKPVPVAPPVIDPDTDLPDHLPRGNGSEPPATIPQPGIARRAVRVDTNGSVQSELDPVVGTAEFYPPPEEMPAYPGAAPGSDDRVPLGVARGTGNGLLQECVAQGIEPSSYTYHSYSMGGSQDSAYEYFPKEDLLLGGLDPVYKTLHINTVEAVKKWLLYRPMTPDERDILFSAKMVTSGFPEDDARKEYEVTHLTCFLGGMFALGGKMYDRPEDVEIGKKLSDGCVWAYSSMPSGIMPEGATVVPCESTQSCPFNETLWWRYLDPSGSYRAKNIMDWEERQVRKKLEREEKMRKQQEADRRAAAEKTLLGEQTQQSPAQNRPPPTEEQGHPEKEMFLDGVKKPAAHSPSANHASSPRPAMPPHPHPIEPKIPNYPRPEPNASHDHGETMEAPRLAKRVPPPKADRSGGGILGKAHHRKDVDLNGQEAGNAMHMTGQEHDSPVQQKPEVPSNPRPGGSRPVAGGVMGQVPIDNVPELPDPRPLSHEEYVKQKLENERIPPGFVYINSRHYILRPEAIESVWYMYRITGDPIWQEKGWRMFEAIIKATRTDVGHSAVADVMDEESRQTDEMESFWMAETLKYFYLLYSTPDVISLDEWVLNTEAHPVRRPGVGV